VHPGLPAPGQYGTPSCPDRFAFAPPAPPRCAPREDSLLEQWTASRQVVHRYSDEQSPEAASWRNVFSSEGRAHWSAAWKKIYAQSCSN